MFSGHHDTWYYGVMDNGAANATMLEVARIAASHRNAWKRGLRFCFWSGHSHGRYSGSAWYADNHYAELDRRSVVHVNVDSTGGRNATVLADAPAVCELLPLAREAVRVQGAQEIDDFRVGRAGDQSFWGIGVPSIFMGLSEQDNGIDVASSIFSGGAQKKGFGFGWWWHTPDDTIDKIDPDILVRDTRVYMHAIARLVGDPVLPFDYTVYADKLDAVIGDLQARLGNNFSLADITHRIAALRRSAMMLARSPASDDLKNGALMNASRALVPLDYVKGDRFAHDPALPLPPCPALDPVRRLAATSPDTDDFRFARVAAQQAVNKAAHALDRALQAFDGM